MLAPEPNIGGLAPVVVRPRENGLEAAVEAAVGP